jgi:hypothetical protein
MIYGRAKGQLVQLGLAEAFMQFVGYDANIAFDLYFTAVQ